MTWYTGADDIAPAIVNAAVVKEAQTDKCFILSGKIY